jgi:hypothetical protein
VSSPARNVRASSRIPWIALMVLILLFAIAFGLGYSL